MNTLLLQPNDVLFFRDGRPMSGSLAGHGAAWPLPTVTSAALHAAIHRAKIDGLHEHRRGKNGNFDDNDRSLKAGSLTTVGPFPTELAHNSDQPTFYYPRPLDAQHPDHMEPTFAPLQDTAPSSLPSPLKYPVASTIPPSKDTPNPWANLAAWQQYLDPSGNHPQPTFKTDADFSDTEHQFGIGIDPETNTQNKEQFYSAHYLRLRQNWSLGILTQAIDKIDNNPGERRDLIKEIFSTKNSLLVGGQQRTCTAHRIANNNQPLPLPIGKSSHFNTAKIDGAEQEVHLVKWTLLTPAIFPAIQNKTTDHPGGWLPTWIDIEGNVRLLNGPGENAAKRKKCQPGTEIEANLVAALTGKPIPVTGYALPTSASKKPGPKPTLYAVPAGSVYYFTCKSKEDATALGNALNWHGKTNGTKIQNRRSTRLGEKGFGIGICSTWSFHNGTRPEIND